MRNTGFYQGSLGLQDPWWVKRVNLDVGGRRGDVWIEDWSEAKSACPKWGEEAANTMHRHLTNILTCVRHHISNARTEGLNSEIQTINREDPLTKKVETRTNP